jgi:hypothetical protein
LTDGLSPIAISLSRHLLEHGDYVVVGILPGEFDSSRGDELRSFMGEIAREGSGATQQDGQMDLDDERDDDEQDGQESDEDAGSTSNSRSSKTKAENRKTKVRRKRWRERFKLVGIDAR